MSKFKGVLSAVSSIFGGGKAPKIPKPEIPAPPAPTRREDTGAIIAIGSDDIRNQRVSGGGTAKKKSATTDVLGNLGKGSGLRI